MTAQITVVDYNGVVFRCYSTAPGIQAALLAIAEQFWKQRFVYRQAGEELLLTGKTAIFTDADGQARNVRPWT